MRSAIKLFKSHHVKLVARAGSAVLKPLNVTDNAARLSTSNYKIAG
jgi:hypothetical protein